MPAAPTRNFSFICGQDDFLVGRMGRRRFEELAGGAADEFSREVISGFAANVDEVGKVVNRFRESVQTIPMFGGRRVVWLKDVNFLADTVTGTAASTLTCVEDLQQVLESVNPAEAAVLVTAAPLDRRRSFPKWYRCSGLEESHRSKPNRPCRTRLLCGIAYQYRFQRRRHRVRNQRRAKKVYPSLFPTPGP